MPNPKNFERVRFAILMIDSKGFNHSGTNSATLLGLYLEVF